MTLNLTSDIAAGLSTLAAAHASDAHPSDAHPEEGSGMIYENGLLIYGAGTALPSGLIDDAIRRSRDERSQHLLGSRTLKPRMLL